MLTRFLRASDPAPEVREACERAMNFHEPSAEISGIRSFMLPTRRGGATTIK